MGCQKKFTPGGFLRVIELARKNPDAGPRYSLVPAYGVAGPGLVEPTAPGGQEPQSPER